MFTGKLFIYLYHSRQCLVCSFNPKLNVVWWIFNTHYVFQNDSVVFTLAGMIICLMFSRVKITDLALDEENEDGK